MQRMQWLVCRAARSVRSGWLPGQKWGRRERREKKERRKKVVWRSSR